MNNVHIQEEKFHEYLDGELPKKDIQNFESHLEDCKQCRIELAQVQELFSVIEAIPTIKYQTNLSAVIVGKIRSTSLITNQGNWAMVFQLIAAIILLFIAIPSLTDTYQLPTISFIESNLSQVFADIPLQINKYAAEIVDGFNSLSLSFGSYYQQSPMAISAIMIWPLVITATLLWLIGNGMLLGNNSSNKAN